MFDFGDLRVRVWRLRHGCCAKEANFGQIVSVIHQSNYRFYLMNRLLEPGPTALDWQTTLIATGGGEKVSNDPVKSNSLPLIGY